jgi:ppGpp synthetase/RelA/SpoT-type nucleotidyltranferase
VALTELQISKLVERYIREQDRYGKMAGLVSRHASARLRDDAIPHMVTFRGKSPESLRGKLTRDRAKHSFDSFDGELTPTLLDLAGVRVLLYRPQDIEPTCIAIEEAFVVPAEDDVPDGKKRFRRDHDMPQGYRARHRIVTLHDELLGSDPEFANLKPVHCEVQVVTLLDHIWNELEHDIKYKTPDGQPSDEQGALLRSLRREIDTAQTTVVDLMDATDRQRGRNRTAIESAQALQQALQDRCGREVNGDLQRLLDLLRGVMREVTPASMSQLSLSGEDLDGAMARLRAVAATHPDLENAVRDDEVTAAIAALWPLHGRAFMKIVKTWRGPRSQVRRLIESLNDVSFQGMV